MKTNKKNRLPCTRVGQNTVTLLESAYRVIETELTGKQNLPSSLWLFHKFNREPKKKIRGILEFWKISTSIKISSQRELRFHEM